MSLARNMTITIAATIIVTYTLLTISIMTIIFWCLQLACTMVVAVQFATDIATSCILVACSDQNSELLPCSALILWARD